MTGFQPWQDIHGPGVTEMNHDIGEGLRHEVTPLQGSDDLWNW